MYCPAISYLKLMIVIEKQKDDSNDKTLTEWENSEISRGNTSHSDNSLHETEMSEQSRGNFYPVAELQTDARTRK